MTALVSVDTRTGECRRYVSHTHGHLQCTHVAWVPKSVLEMGDALDLQSIEDLRRFGTYGKPAGAVA